MREDIRDIIRDLCKWKGVVIIEGKVMPDHSSAAVNSAEVFRVQLYGISEGEKCDDDIRASREFEV